jgi:hypothetical protein
MVRFCLLGRCHGSPDLGAAFSDGGCLSPDLRAPRRTAVAGGQQQGVAVSCPANLGRMCPIQSSNGSSGPRGGRYLKNLTYRPRPGWTLDGISFAVQPRGRRVAGTPPRSGRSPVSVVVPEAVARPVIEFGTGNPSPPEFAFAPTEVPPSRWLCRRDRTSQRSGNEDTGDGEEIGAAGWVFRQRVACSSCFSRS